MTTTPPTPVQPPPYGWRPPPPPLAPTGQPLAGFGDRFLAYLIDYAIQFAVSLLWVVPFAIWWFSTWFGFVERMQRDFDPYDPYGQYDPYATQPMSDEILGEMIKMYLVMFLFVGVGMLFGLMFTYLYFVEYQLRRGGQTLGKKVMKIAVIPVQPGQSLTRLDLVKRWSVQWVVGVIVPLFNYVDGLWQLWDKPLQQCLHDKAAATVVVKVG